MIIELLKAKLTNHYYSDAQILQACLKLESFWNAQKPDGTKPIQASLNAIFQSVSGRLLTTYLNNIALAVDGITIDETDAEQLRNVGAFETVMSNIKSYTTSFLTALYNRGTENIATDFEGEISRLLTYRTELFGSIRVLLNDGNLDAFPDIGTLEWTNEDTLIKTYFPDDFISTIRENYFFTAIIRIFWLIIANAIIALDTSLGMALYMYVNEEQPPEVREDIESTLAVTLDIIGAETWLGMTPTEFKEEGIFKEWVEWLIYISKYKIAVKTVQQIENEIATEVEPPGVFIGTDIPDALLESMIINPRSLSHDKIMEDLMDDAMSNPEDIMWKDWLESSGGKTIVRWIAAVATTDVYHKIVGRFEQSVEFARHKTSLIEHGFNKGFCLNPTFAPVLNITVENDSDVPYSIAQGDLVGMMSDYEVYAEESVIIAAGDRTTFKVIVGTKELFTKHYSPLGKYTEIKFETQKEYIASQLEEFKTDDTVRQLYSDLNYLKSIEETLILRRVKPYNSILYIGNGVLGWWEDNVQDVYYTCLTYNEDISEVIEGSIALLVDLNLVTTEIYTAPAFFPEKEELRSIAIHYPRDGRIVQSKDYSVQIMKWFGGVLLDCYSYNSDPDEEVYLLLDDNYVAGHLDQIKEMIDSKREQGIQVYYHEISPDTGIEFFPSFRVKRSVYNNRLSADINTELNKLMFKFSAQDEFTMKTDDLAVILTNKLGFQIYAADDLEVTLGPTDFFKNLVAQVKVYN